MNFTPGLVDSLKASAFMDRLLREKKVIMDNTEFSYWNGCFVSGLYFGGWRKSPTDGQAPLLFGQAVHIGMKSLLTGHKIEEALAAADLEARRVNLNSLLDPRRNTQTLADLLTAYAAHINIVPTERLVPVELDGTPVVEKSFSFPIGKLHFKAGDLFSEDTEIEVWWSGIMDALVYYHNYIYICDHKTTSVMGEKFADDKQRSSQMLGYTLAARMLQHLLSRPVHGVLINALALRKNDFEFRHFPLPMASWKVDEFANEVLEAMSEIIRKVVNFVHHGVAVPNREHCVTKYGKCRYFGVCENPPSIRERLLNEPSLFKENTWNPLE